MCNLILLFFKRNSYKERDEWNRVLERRDAELNSLKESHQNLQHRLGTAEGKVSAVEHEVTTECFVYRDLP